MVAKHKGPPEGKDMLLALSLTSSLLKDPLCFISIMIYEVGFICDRETDLFWYATRIKHAFEIRVYDEFLKFKFVNFSITSYNFVDFSKKKSKMNLKS